ncbi:methyltransferase family protein [Gelidibacter algens]|uniref:Methyltransferase family protein n=1 Tax=Gelidibacter algens TaxID=49280 RepID=A0A1A7R8I7_9FLAO|nr:class I SAM-dependent methyltransferase [Gelidibacter algens]OBX27042.1 methyltransferase [Gelidibacter algens]RAJ28013.1 methyltransferase family protein [Gelidibacter algens]
MYTALKKITKALIPKKFLLKHEFALRRLFAIQYLGTKHHCEICKTKLNRFIKLKPNDLLCPACGSRSRTRRLYHLLLKDNALQGNVLHFSPSRSLYRVYKKIEAMSYVSTDFENEFVADYTLDIRKIDFKDQYFDTIICYHILEHIEEDFVAMKELYRVLSPNGKCYIQTPFKDGNIYEDASMVSESERFKAFGQKDHVRLYSIEGLKERLERVGFKVSILTFTPQEEDVLLGYQSPETVLIASKT